MVGRSEWGERIEKISPMEMLHHRSGGTLQRSIDHSERNGEGGHGYRK